MTTPTLRQRLLALVTAAGDGSQPNAVEYLCEMLRQAEERRDRQAAGLIRLALAHAER
jgi:hypothetical protein